MASKTANFSENSAFNRRQILCAGAMPFLGLGLPSFLAAKQNTVIPKTARAKACIVLFMWGGPAHQDTWDMKPESPVEYRGEFKPIATKVPGLQICEHLPKLAARTDKLAIIRSMTHSDVDHTSATHFLLTGRDRLNRSAPIAEDWPNYGAILSYLGRGNGLLPPYVSMMPVVPNGAPRFVESSHGQGAGWLGPKYNPMRIDSDASSSEYKVGELDLRQELASGRLDERRALQKNLQTPRKFHESETQQALGGQYQRAYDLLASPKARKAFDLSQEPMKLRERYGMNRHGQSVLQARRLVEAGVPLVTVFWPNDGITNVSVYWDTHNRNFVDLKERLCPVTDQAFSALLDDLESRGMLDETMVLWTGEMGRTPRVGQSVVGGAGAGKDGRDHWANCFTSILAGGGIRGGTVYGKSDRYAAYPSENPTRPADLVATMYHCLGLPRDSQLLDKLNRPIPIIEGDIIQPILS